MSLFIVTANTILEHNTLNCHLLHVSAIVYRHQVDFITKYIEKNTEAECSKSRVHSDNKRRQQLTLTTTTTTTTKKKDGLIIPKNNLLAFMFIPCILINKCVLYSYTNICTIIVRMLVHNEHFLNNLFAFIFVFCS